MPLPRLGPSWGPYLRLELRNLIATPSFWTLLLLLCPLTGYSFLQAVTLYGEASRWALKSAELARGLSPLDGVLVPTFGAVYLAATLLFPFLAIRLISNEKETKTLKLLLQSPLSTYAILGIKAAALAVAWIAVIAIPWSSIVLWSIKGGHIGWQETFNLIGGHSLYGFAIVGIAFLSAAVTDSAPGAAILSFAVVLGNWAWDFSAATQGGWLRGFSTWSFTACLHSFERGMFSSVQAFELLILGACLIAVAAIWLRTGWPKPRRWRHTLTAIGMGILVLNVLSRVPVHKDVSEDRRNSLNPADERALAQMREPLEITVYLSPEDSRLWDLERGLLSKLRRLVPKLRLRYGDAGNDRYGLLVFQYRGKTEETRSNSEEEILPILHGLAGQRVTPEAVPDYPGHPFVADFSRAWIWFYVLLPGLIAASWWCMGGAA